MPGLVHVVRFADARRCVRHGARAVDHRGVRLRPPRLLARPLLGLLSGLTVSAQSIHTGKVQPPVTLGSIVLNGSRGTTTRVGAPSQVVDPVGNPTQRCASASTAESASINDARADPTASSFAGS